MVNRDIAGLRIDVESRLGFAKNALQEMRQRLADMRSETIALANQIIDARQDIQCMLRGAES